MKRRIISLSTALLIAASSFAGISTVLAEDTANVATSNQNDSTVKRTNATRQVDYYLLYTPADSDYKKDAYIASCAAVNIISADFSDTSDSYIAKVTELGKTLIKMKGLRFEVPKLTLTVKSSSSIDKAYELYQALADGWYIKDEKPVILADTSIKDERFTVIDKSKVKTFTMEDIVKEDVIKSNYTENNWQNRAPAAPVSWGLINNYLTLTYSGYPTEYMMSADKKLSDGEWKPINVSTGLPYGELLEKSKKIYVKTRNIFGESPVSEFAIENTKLLYQEGDKGKIYEEDFSDIALRDMKQNWEFRPSDIPRLKKDQGGFDTSEGYLLGRWINGRSARLKTLLNDYTLTLDFHADLAATKQGGGKSAIAIRQPLEAINPIYEETTNNKTGETTLGAFGIYFLCYNDADNSNAPVLEIMVHKTDVRSALGAYSTNVYIDLPSSISFDEFQNISVKDEGETISVSVNGTVYATIKLSELGKTGNRKYLYDGEMYRKAEVFDASGKLLATVEKAEIPAEGYLLFTTRNNAFHVDNIVIEVN